ncbi:MAG: M56 family metallopeptidase [Chlamydiales bacterium]
MMIQDTYWKFFFNVLVNSGLVFITMVLFIELCLFIFRVKQQRVKAICRTIPLLKLCVDFFLYNFSSWALMDGLNPIEAEPGTRMISVIMCFCEELNYPLIFSSGIQLLLNKGMTFTFTLADLVILSVNIFWIKLSVVVCFLGSMLFSFRQIMRMIESKKMISDIVQTSWASPRIIENAFLQKILKKSKVKILISCELDVPCAIGFAQKKVIFPAQLLDKFTQTEYEAVIAHEIAHLRWYDSLVRIVSQLIKAIFWWIPFKSWLSLLEQTQEKACDDYVGTFNIPRMALASAIVKSVKQVKSKRQPMTAIGFVEQCHSLNRMKAILTEAKPGKIGAWRVLKNLMIGLIMTTLLFGKFWIF